jgi:dihydroorotase-like cyclic amidohydrolase
MNRRIAFRNARLIDPASGLDAKGGLLVENGVIVDVGPRLFNDAEPNDPEVIDCRGLVLAPGLIDCRVFTGEPGGEHRESLESASMAAAATAKVRVLPCALKPMATAPSPMRACCAALSPMPQRSTPWSSAMPRIPNWS